MSSTETHAVELIAKRVFSVRMGLVSSHSMAKVPSSELPETLKVTRKLFSRHKIKSNDDIEEQKQFLLVGGASMSIEEGSIQEVAIGEK